MSCCSVKNYLVKLGEKNVRANIKMAFETWKPYCGLTFKEVNHKQFMKYGADIVISFGILE